MSKVSFIVSSHQAQNRIFDYSVNNPVNRDGGVYPFYLLKERLSQQHINISTADILPPESADLLLCLDIPQNFSKLPKDKKKILIITESELIKPDNWNLKFHSEFEKIFTWNDNFVDNKKYLKLNFSNKIEWTKPEQTLRDRFCCLIAGAKTCQHPLELYSERMRTIRWFEKEHPEDFALYGVGWDRYQFKGPIFIRAFNRVDFLRRVMASAYPSYRGKIDSKRSILQSFQFSICYENAHSIPGYITEKIFDSLFAGCIPIYWGAPNIEKYIPENCFIDRRKFSSVDELYQFMKSMSMNDIKSYQENIYTYLNSSLVDQFSGENFSSVISDVITKALS